MGWVEFSLEDASIPSNPLGDPLRPTCSLVLALDAERLIDRRFEAQGEGPPYRLTVAYRVSVAAGSYLAKVEYAGCRFVGVQADVLQAEIQVPVVAGRTTRVEFNGAMLRWSGQLPARTF